MNYSDNTKIAKALRSLSDTKEMLAQNLAEVDHETRAEIERAADMETALYWMIVENPDAKIPHVTKVKLRENWEQLRNGKEVWGKLLGSVKEREEEAALNYFSSSERVALLEAYTDFDSNWGAMAKAVLKDGTRWPHVRDYILAQKKKENLL